MQYLSSLNVGDYFFHWEEYEDGFRDLELARYRKKWDKGGVDSETIYNSNEDMSSNTFYKPSKTLVSKLVPDNSLSRSMYPNYVECKELKGYLIDKKFYKIKKELDAMN